MWPKSLDLIVRGNTDNGIFDLSAHAGAHRHICSGDMSADDGKGTRFLNILIERIEHQGRPC